MDTTLSFLRHPKFLYLVKASHGDEAEVMVEEIIKSGSDTETNILLKTAKRLHEALEGEAVSQAPSISDLHSKFCDLVASNIIRRCDELGQHKAEAGAAGLLCPHLVENKDDWFRPVEVDVQAISAAVTGKSESVEAGQDQAVFWRLNIAKCELLLRNKMIVAAAARRVDEQAGKVVESLLRIVDRWEDAPISPLFSHPIISDQVARDHGKDSLAHIYLDQYLRVLADDKTRFVDRVGDSGGGQYHVDLKHIVTSLVEATIDCVVLERFSSKAVRVFRYIREKRYVEEGQLQQVVMIPAKETKMLTYQLLENHFIHLQELRKSVAPTAPSKSFHLYYCDLPQVRHPTIAPCSPGLSSCRW